MSKLAAIVEDKRWTQIEAAQHCGVTQPRINELLRGRLSRFSLDALVNIAAALGQRVHVELDAANGAGRGKGKAELSVQKPLRRLRLTPEPQTLRSPNKTKVYYSQTRAR
jgi:transcriptional regulator with XRE-family HTH domain